MKYRIHLIMAPFQNFKLKILFMDKKSICRKILYKKLNKQAYICIVSLSLSFAFSIIYLSIHIHSKTQGECPQNLCPHKMFICIYLTFLPWARYDTRLVFNELQMVWIRSFPSRRQVAMPKWKNAIYPLIPPSLRKDEINSCLSSKH